MSHPIKSRPSDQKSELCGLELGQCVCVCACAVFCEENGEKGREKSVSVSVRLCLCACAVFCEENGEKGSEK